MLKTNGSQCRGEEHFPSGPLPGMLVSGLTNVWELHHSV